MIRIKTVALVIPFFIVMIIMVIQYYRNRRNVDPVNNGLVLINFIFITYVFLVIGVLYFPLYVNYNDPFTVLPRFNLVPILPILEEINYRDMRLTTTILLQVFANLALFIPLSAYLAYLRADSNRRNMIILIAVSLSAEIAQLALTLVCRFCDRVFDVNDILLNLSGSLLAYRWFSSLMIKKKPNGQVKD
ncbi:MAG TPA: hypothetical protein DCM45_05260 [Clostridiales bacterium]|nr:hypothetical protein [Clostridiales bacterium]